MASYTGVADIATDIEIEAEVDIEINVTDSDSGNDFDCDIEGHGTDLTVNIDLGDYKEEIREELREEVKEEVLEEVRESVREDLITELVATPNPIIALANFMQEAGAAYNGVLDKIGEMYKSTIGEWKKTVEVTEAEVARANTEVHNLRDVNAKQNLRIVELQEKVDSHLAKEDEINKRVEEAKKELEEVDNHLAKEDLESLGVDLESLGVDSNADPRPEAQMVPLPKQNWKDIDSVLRIPPTEEK